MYKDAETSVGVGIDLALVWPILGIVGRNLRYWFTLLLQFFSSPVGSPASGSNNGWDGQDG